MKSQVYIKLKKKAETTERVVRVSDVAEIFCEKENQAFVAKTAVIRHIDDQKRFLAVSGLEVIRILQKKLPGCDFTMLGAEDCLVTYRIPNPRETYMVWAKTVLVSVLLFFGSAFAIMTFNEDVSVSALFEKLAKIFPHHVSAYQNWLEGSYSVGLPLGIMIFYNHFFRKKITEDPTPLQIEMNDYEQKANQTIMDMQERKQGL